MKNNNFDDLRQESIKSTVHNRIYKNLFYGKVLGLCCSPHKGCNKIPARRNRKTNWKYYRQKQYKIK